MANILLCSFRTVFSERSLARIACANSALPSPNFFAKKLLEQKMENLIVVNNPDKWILNLPNTRVVSPKQYITNSEFAQLGKYKVYNLCNVFNYQNMGYYASLLAFARMHHPEPSVRTIMDFSSRKMLESLAPDVEHTANKVLAKPDSKHCFGDEFKLDVCFGKCENPDYNKIGRILFARFNAPMFTAKFRRRKSGWKLRSIEPFGAADITRENRKFITETASAYLASYHKISDWQDRTKYSMAILVDEDEKYPPSNEKALARFVRAAQKAGFYCELITKHDFDRLKEFDALFIRATTNVDNYTYKFSRCAQTDGIVVIDDPASIVRCANKVFQAEQAQMRKVPMPKTMILHRDNVFDVEAEIGFPLVIKQPDSQFSQGVFKAEDAKSLEKITGKLFKHSSLLIAQKFVPTKFDWRIGILDRKAIYACKYYMAQSHWQIVNKDAKGSKREGDFDALKVSDVPKKILDIALRMANSIGDGLYGVDLKETDDGQILMIEVNDNPSIDAGIEDKVEGINLYQTIIKCFAGRIDKIRRLSSSGTLRK